MALQVTAELIQVHDEATGASHTIARGAPLPDFVKGDQLKHLKELSLVGEAESSDSKSSRKSSN